MGIYKMAIENNTGLTGPISAFRADSAPAIVRRDFNPFETKPAFAGSFNKPPLAEGTGQKFDFSA